MLKPLIVEIMNKEIKILLLFGLIAIIVLGCCKNDEDVYRTMEIKKITDFGCDTCSISLKQEYQNNCYYFIYTIEAFDLYVYYKNGPGLTTIDFENYFLIIGHKTVSAQAKITGEKAEESKDEIKYTVNILQGYLGMPDNIVYYAFLKKPSSDKTLIVKEIIK